MRLKSKAHEALSHVFLWDGLLSAIICDNIKKMIKGEFNRKLKEATCHLQQTKIHPMVKCNRKRYKSTAEGSERKLIKSKTFNGHCDDCWKFEYGEVTKTVMSGETSDFCEFCWFKCVIFQGKTAPYLDDHFKVGWYLEPSKDVGPAMTVKILTRSSQVLHRSMHQVLIQDELGKLWEQRTTCNIHGASSLEIRSSGYSGRLSWLGWRRYAIVWLIQR